MVTKDQRASAEHGGMAALRWAFTRKPERWPRWVDSEPGPPPPGRVDDGVVRWTVINHATVLIQLAGVNVLTDPIWSQRCSPVPWAGPKRVRAPGLRWTDLPPIDLLLLSHDHYDHCDVPTLRRLAARDRSRAVTGLGNAPLLKRAGYRDVEELEWWQSVEHRGLRVTYVPTQHFSGRGMLGRNRTWWGGFVIESEKRRVYFVGDTGYNPETFVSVRKRLGAPDLAFIPIGAYDPAWFMGRVHVDPEQAVQIHRDIRSRQSVAIHFGTFQLTDESIDEPAERLLAAREEAGLEPDEFVVPELGRGQTLEATDS